MLLLVLPVNKCAYRIIGHFGFSGSCVVAQSTVKIRTFACLEQPRCVICIYVVDLQCRNAGTSLLSDCHDETCTRVCIIYNLTLPAAAAAELHGGFTHPCKHSAYDSRTEASHGFICSKWGARLIGIACRATRQSNGHVRLLV